MCWPHRVHRPKCCPLHRLPLAKLLWLWLRMCTVCFVEWPDAVYDDSADDANGDDVDVDDIDAYCSGVGNCCHCCWCYRRSYSCLGVVTLQSDCHRIDWLMNSLPMQMRLPWRPHDTVQAISLQKKEKEREKKWSGYFILFLKMNQSVVWCSYIENVRYNDNMWVRSMQRDEPELGWGGAMNTN